jgi:short-subunit dehydrogenase
MATTRSLDGAVVAVVGPGGLGAPIARRLAGRGADLVLVGRDPLRLAAVASDLPSDGSVLEVVADVRDPSAGDRIVDAVRAGPGRLDGVVFAHGVVAFGNLADTDDEAIEEVFLTNVLGPLWCLKRLVPLLAAPEGSRDGGFVVNLSAVVAEQPVAGMSVYSASKAAITAADAALSRELRRIGVSVCDVRPPHTETGLADRPVAGVAPRLPEGLDPEVVAERIVVAIETGEAAVPADAFGT